MTANLALSLNRNMWAGLLLGLAVLMFIGGVRVRRPVGVGVLALVGAIALIAIAGVQVDRGPLAGFAERGQTLFSPEKTTQENSLQDRGKETEQAWRTIKEHPVIGIGPGAEFGVYFDELQPGGMSYKRTHQLFLHNQYLYLLLICGIPGLLAFLGFLTAAVGRARWHLSDTDIATWAVGVGMIALSAFVMISIRRCFQCIGDRPALRGDRGRDVTNVRRRLTPYSQGPARACRSSPRVDDLARDCPVPRLLSPRVRRASCWRATGC